MNKEVIVSVKTVLITLAILLGLYVTYELRGILSILFLALILVISLEGAVEYFSKFTLMNKPMPRNVAVILVYASFLLVIILAFTTAVPLVVSQSQNLVDNFSHFLVNFEINGQNLFESLSFLDVLSEFTKQGNISKVLLNSVSMVSSFLTLIVISVYLSLDWYNIKARFFALFRKKVRKDVEEIFEKIEVKIGAWVKGQVTTMLVVGFLGYIGYSVVGMNYSLALGFVGGVLEIVPILGPVFTAVIATAVGFAHSPLKGFLALGVSIIVQQIEGNFLTPKIMQKVSGFSPLVILIALLIGAEFFGIVGAILAVPITMILGILFDHFIGYSSVRE